MAHAVRVRTLILALLVLVPLAGCSAIGRVGGATTMGSAPFEQGSGNAASEARSIGGFHAVSAAEGVQVVVSTGSPGVTVSADDNLLAHVSTTVNDGVLVVDISGGVETRLPLRVVVSMSTPPDGLSASTGATIDAGALAGNAVEVGASTGATIHGGGQVDVLRVSASTGASVDLGEVEATRAQVVVNTGSTASVNASEAVTGSCTGGSTLRVHGAATTSGVTVDESSTLAAE